MSVLLRILSFLESQNIQYKRMDHEPTPTSEASAKARGESLHIGGKALCFSMNSTLVLVVISASKRIDSKKLKKVLNAKSLRFATDDELITLGDLTKGAVPPFGEPLLPLKLYIDKTITENPEIAFNAGSLTTSLLINTNDYLRVAGGEIIDVAES